MNTARRGPFITLAVAVALLSATWLLVPSPAPPLYDGLGFPDEPYRYVSPPPGAKPTKPPGTASGDAHLLDGVWQYADGNSGEVAPQVTFVLGKGVIIGPPGATIAHVRAAPVAAISQPSNARIWGNVYRLTVTTDAGTGGFDTRSSFIGELIMRAPSGPTPEPVMEFFDGHTWRQQSVNRRGNDVYAGLIAGVGDYALATPGGQAQPPPVLASPPRGIDRWAIITPAIALGILIVAIGVLRWARRGRRGTGSAVDRPAWDSFLNMVHLAVGAADPADKRRVALTQLRQMLAEPAPDPHQLRGLTEVLVAGLRSAPPSVTSEAAVVMGQQLMRDLRR